MSTDWRTPACASGVEKAKVEIGGFFLPRIHRDGDFSPTAFSLPDSMSRSGMPPVSSETTVSVTGASVVASADRFLRGRMSELNPERTAPTD